MFLAALPVLAQGGHETTVKLLKNEKWWGLFLSGSPAQPFAEPFSVDMAAPESGRQYVPMMVSSEGRYLWSKEPFNADFDGDQMTVKSQHEKVEVQKSGKTLREAYLTCVHKNFPPSGEIPAVEFFTMPLYETFYELGHAQGHDELVGYAERLLAEGFPKGILVICDGWASLSSGRYEFSSELYPDPRATIEKLHSLGFKVMLTVSPYAPKAGRNYVKALREGRLVGPMEKTGYSAMDSYSYNVDGTATAFYDMSRQDNFEWLKNGVDGIASGLPVDFFRFDCSVAGRLNFEARRLDRQAFVANCLRLAAGLEQRSEVVGIDRGMFPPYVTGFRYSEPEKDYPQMPADILNDMLSRSLAGFPYSHVESSMLALLNNPRHIPVHMALQCGMPVVSIEFAPWSISDRNLYDAVKSALLFRASVAEYMENLVKESAKTGEPIVRHLEYQFPRQGFSDCDDQFMLGPKYLIAPCVDGGPKRMVRLPKGRWTDKAGKTFRGPLVTEAECSGGLIYFELAK